MLNATIGGLVSLQLSEIVAIDWPRVGPWLAGALALDYAVRALYRRARAWWRNRL